MVHDTRHGAASGCGLGAALQLKMIILCARRHCVFMFGQISRRVRQCARVRVFMRSCVPARVCTCARIKCREEPPRHLSPLRGPNRLVSMIYSLPIHIHIPLRKCLCVCLPVCLSVYICIVSMYYSVKFPQIGQFVLTIGGSSAVALRPCVQTDLKVSGTPRTPPSSPPLPSPLPSTSSSPSNSPQ